MPAPTLLEKALGYGLVWPLRREGGHLVAAGGETKIRGNLQTILSVPRGRVLWDSRLGTRLHSYRHRDLGTRQPQSQGDEQTTRMRNEVLAALASQAPNVQVQAVEASATYDTLTVRVRWRIPDPMRAEESLVGPSVAEISA